MRPDLEDYDDLSSELEEAPRSRAMSWLVLIVAVGGFAALAYYAYHSSSGSSHTGEVLVVQADQGPIKQVPTDKEGEEFPNQDKTIYDVITPAATTGEKSEKLLPEPEKPVAAAPHEVKDDEDSTSADTPAPAPATTTYVNKSLAGGASNADSADAKAAGKSTKNAPAPLKMPEAPVEAKAATPAAKPMPTTEVKVAAATPPSASAPTFVNESPVVGTKAAAPAPAKAATAPAKKAESKPATKPVAAATSKGDYKVQLGAFKSEAEAQANWKKITGKFPGTIGGSPIIVKADLSNGTFYRLRASGFASESDAKAACAKLTAAKQPCFPAGK
jgi:cell division protein FtsN